MPTITLPIPVYELLAEISQTTEQGQDIRKALLDAALGKFFILSDK